MSVRISITIEVDDELADEDHATGLTEEGHDQLMDALLSVGSLVSGPDRV